MLKTLIWKTKNALAFLLDLDGLSQFQNTKKANSIFNLKRNHFFARNMFPREITNAKPPRKLLNSEINQQHEIKDTQHLL